MADLSYYKKKFGITTEPQAFEKFLGTLQNYYDAGFYVDWEKVFSNAKRHEREYALLSTLCGKADKKKAARDLLEAYPQIIPALPTLMACRNEVTLVTNAEKAQVAEFDFAPLGGKYAASEADRYAHFIVDSGIIEIFEHIKSVGDYVTGVEVGIDTNARKNRGGDCGIKAIDPLIVRARESIAGLDVKSEASFDFLGSKGFVLPGACRGIDWDYALWIKGGKHLVVMEVNHYGGIGSKPPAIAREYTARQTTLKSAGIGFVWVTDGLGWKSMKNPLYEAFSAIDFIVNIKLALDGQLEDALRTLLLNRGNGPKRVSAR